MQLAAGAIYTPRAALAPMESSDMEYLSAIAPLLILMLFGGGIVIVAYLAFDDMRTRGSKLKKAPSFSEYLMALIARIRALPTGTLIVAGAAFAGLAFVYLVAASGYYAAPPAPPAAVSESSDSSAPAPAAPAAKTAAAPAAAVGAAEAAVRTVTSATCAADGCPVTCGPQEILTSAYCVSGGVARLTDQLQVKDGVVTAKCSSAASSIKVACARK